VLEGAPLEVPAHGGEEWLHPGCLHVFFDVQVPDTESVPGLRGGVGGEPPPTEDQVIRVPL
jgi:hypothetical protein